jgi:hypothetical protein
MNWEDAKKACATLGKGWRLPTQYELNILYKNKDKIGGFNTNRYYYWNTKLYSEGLRWTVDFSDGYPYQEFESKDNNVRAIRSFFVSDKEFIIDSASVIGKSIRVGNLVVAQYDFPDEMIMNDAIKACAALGKGWRLPTKNELNILYKNKDKIGGFTVKGSSYQSSTRLDYYDTWDQTFFNGNQGYGANYWPHSIRAVRDLFVRDIVIDSASMIIGKAIRIKNLVVAQHDFPKRMNWFDAKKACVSLGKGWRLPTKDELYTLYYNKDKIGGFGIGFYWSSTVDNNSNAWSWNFYGEQINFISNMNKYDVRAVKAF